MSTKTCGTCREEKTDDLFYKKTRKTKISLTSDCIACIKTKQDNYRSDSKVQEAAKNRAKAWRQENPEKVKANNEKYCRVHYQNNKGYYNSKSTAREIWVKQATPPWSNPDDIRKVYELCARITKRTGVAHEVDHAIPLKGKNVCGLHTFKNLQIVPQTMNRQKSNKFEPDTKRDWE